MTAVIAPWRDARVFSFDVFDTVVTRTVAKPAGIFFLMQQCLMTQREDYPAALVRDFGHARARAERTARSVKEREEIEISDIYRTMGQWFALDRRHQEALIDLELAMERESIRPVPLIIDEIRRLRDLGMRVIFVTDTYLPRGFIAETLKAVGALEEPDGLYVSSEVGLVKATGRLFGYVLETEGCRPWELVHLGDNFEGDIRPARKLGIRAWHYTEAHLTRYETIILGGGDEGGPSPLPLWHLLAGASRLARFDRHLSGAKERTLRLIGANLAGPILAGYVIWLLHEAKTSGLERLYFLSRDGQILLEVAQRLSAKVDCRLDLRYLYASRQAWHLPSIQGLDEEELEWLLDAPPFLSLRSVSERTGINVDLLRNELRIQTGCEWDPDEDLTNDEIGCLRRLVSSGAIAEAILRRAREARRGVEGYFAQEGLLDDVAFGIVDLGWLGRLQDSLARLLTTMGARGDRPGFYFGLVRNPGGIEGQKKRAFFFYPGAKQAYWEAGTRFINLLEILTAADHGLTMGYVRAGGSWRPLLKTLRNDGALAAGLTALRAGILAFVDSLPASIVPDILDRLDTYRERICSLMLCLLDDPTREEAQALGDFPFSSDQTEMRFYRFAPPFSFVEALEYGFSGSWRRRTALTHWVAGTRARSSPFTGLLLHPFVHEALRDIERFLRLLPGLNREILPRALRKISDPAG